MTDSTTVPAQSENYMKLPIEYIKYLTGLSTGAIVTLTTFMELMPQGSKGPWMAWAIGGFTTTVLLASIFYTLILLNIKKKYYPVLFLCLGLVWLAFFIGILCLGRIGIIVAMTA